MDIPKKFGSPLITTKPLFSETSNNNTREGRMAMLSSLSQ